MNWEPDKEVTTLFYVITILCVTGFFFIVFGFALCLHLKRKRDMAKEQEMQEKRRLEMLLGKEHSDEAELYRIYRQSIAVPMDSEELLETIHQDIIASDISDQPAQPIPAGSPKHAKQTRQEEEEVLEMEELDDPTPTNPILPVSASNKAFESSSSSSVGTAV